MSSHLSGMPNNKTGSAQTRTSGSAGGRMTGVCVIGDCSPSSAAPSSPYPGNSPPTRRLKDTPGLPTGPPTCVWWRAGRAYSGEPDAGFCSKPGPTWGFVCDRRFHNLEMDDERLLQCCELPDDEDDTGPYYNPV